MITYGGCGRIEKTYGTIAYERGSWVLRPEAHVALKLKRVFPRVSKRQQGRIKISDTPEVTHDLEWFITRYPMRWVNEADRDRMRVTAEKQREAVDLAASLMAGTRDPRHFNLALPLRSYQAAAAELALIVKGLLVGDDLGTGKSAIAIGMLCDPRTRPALVVTMTHLTHQWAAEIRKFNPSLRTHIITKSTPYDVRVAVHRRVNGQQLPLLHDGVPDVLVVNYHKLHGWAETLAGVVHCVVFDEIQELRRGTESNKGAAAYLIASKAEFRLGLSATPIFNYGGEIYNVLQPLRPNELGTKEEFHTEWCSAHHDKPRIQDPKAFGVYLRDQALMIRRTRAEVSRELPRLTNVPHYVDCDQEQIARIEDDATELARVILSQNQEPGAKFRASEELSNLVRQATGIAKAPFVAAFVRLLVEQGESVVLFGWHRECYTIWNARLRDLAPVMFTGTESTTQKEAAKNAFVTGRSKLLMMSLRAGAGLDGLQHVCRTVVFGELDWSPGVMEQCSGRIHRDGQRDPVTAYYLLAEAGSDPIMVDVLGLKRAQSEGIRDPHAELVTRLDAGVDHVRLLAERYLRGKAA